MNRNNLSPWLIRGGYAFALLLVVWPVVDIVTSVWPLRAGDLQWRYGAAGLLAGYLHTPILGLAIATALAAVSGGRRMLRSLAVVEILAVLVLLAVAGIFPLDALQVRAARPPEMQPSMTAGSVIAELKHVTAIVVLLLLAVGTWAQSRRVDGEERKSGAGGAGIVLGGTK